MFNTNSTRMISVLFLSISLYACSAKKEAGQFSLNGQISNLTDQDVYLEMLSFNDKPSEVVDTAKVVKGKFVLTGVNSEQGLYRVRFQQAPALFLVINDQDQLNLTADANPKKFTDYTLPSAGNNSLRKFLETLFAQADQINTLKMSADSQRTDSARSLLQADLIRLKNEQQGYLVKYIDTCSNPVAVMFALGYTKEVDPALLKGPVTAMTKRFPNHQGVAGIVAQYNQYLAQLNQPVATPAQTAKIPGVGDAAPDFTMNDVEGKPFALSQLKGSYVLIDFWASWCGPCRGENPNVVAAYNKYKSKNFTILGVSLDEDKDAWLKAIKTDQLTWKQVSDLKGWQNPTVGLYGFDGIPYNVLLDPKGTIIATGLRGKALEDFLEKTLK